MRKDLPDLYYEIDIDDPDRFRYHRAALGVAFPPPPHLVAETDYLTERHETFQEEMHKAVEAIITARTHNAWQLDRIEGYRTAYDILLPFSEDDAQHCRLMSYALYVAQEDTRYWGIEDPTLESVCSRCRKQRPINFFSSSPNICKECQ